MSTEWRLFVERLIFALEALTEEHDEAKETEGISDEEPSPCPKSKGESLLRSEGCF